MIATSTTRTERTGCTAGFTLVELLVVLAIMALLAVVAVKAMSGRTRMAERAQAARLVKLINDTRARAILEGKVEDLTQAKLPNALRVASSAGALLRWYPDGSALAASVSNGSRVLMTINPVTGLPEDQR